MCSLHVSLCDFHNGNREREGKSFSHAMVAFAFAFEFLAFIFTIFFRLNKSIVKATSGLAAVMGKIFVNQINSRRRYLLGKHQTAFFSLQCAQP
jgi:hypothetical protein